MIEETNQSESFQQLMSVLYLGNHIDEMTKTWICQTPAEPPHIPIFYTLRKIHRLTPVGRPLVSGSDGLVATKKLSSFVYILQPAAQQQKSYLKETTHFINFVEKTDEGSRKHNPCFHGRYELIYKYTKTGGDKRPCSEPT